jgi:hypothetical protein
MVADTNETGDAVPRGMCGGLIEKAEAVPVYVSRFSTGETGKAESECAAMRTERSIYVHERHRTPLAVRALFAWTFFS